jgi:hypothetical protein
MNHPSEEEWMAYLYDELPKAAKAPFTAHLEACADCQQSVAAWQKTMTGLTQWKVPVTRIGTPKVGSIRPSSTLRWAVAAVLALGGGIAIGRLAPLPISASAKTALVADLRRQVQDEVKADQQRWLADFIENYETQRQQDLQRVSTLFNRADEKRQIENLRLRRAIETVAVVAADKFQRTETELGHLASYAQAEFTTDDLDEPLTPQNQPNRKGH